MSPDFFFLFRLFLLSTEKGTFLFFSGDLIRSLCLETFRGQAQLDEASFSYFTSSPFFGLILFA